MEKQKYVTVTVSGVVMAIAKTTDIKGYTETVLEPMLPSDEELEKMSDSETDKFIEENNSRMEAICKFMNDNNL